MKVFNLVKANQLLVSVTHDSKPYDYFVLLLDDIFLEEVGKVSNMYAQQTYNNVYPKKKHVRINIWKDLSGDELKVFLGLILCTGILSLP